MPVIPETRAVVLNYRTDAQHSEHSLFQSLPVMLHSIDATGTVIDVNRRWLEILGYSRTEVIGKKSIDFLTEESKAFATENILPEFFRTGRCLDVPYQIVAKDGRVLDVLLSATCERDAQGQIVRSLAVIQDITARKLAERKLDSTRAYLENLFRTTKAVVVELDTGGLVRRVNEAAALLTGYTQQELDGANWYNLLVPRQRYPEVWRKFEQFISHSQDGEFEHPILTKSGEERFIHWHNSPVVQEGKLLGTFSIGIDVTSQHQMELRLAENERFLKDAQSVAQIGSWAIDYEHHRLRWSDATYEILGLDPRTPEPPKAVFRELMHPEDRDEVVRTYRAALRANRPYEVRHRLIMRDGSIKYVRQKAEITYSTTGVPVRAIGTFQDITMAVLQELATQESEERFRTIADFTYDWEYWQGNDKEILYISPSCMRITGYSQSDFIRDPDLLNKIVHPDDRSAFAQHLTQVSSDREGHQLDFRILTKDGQLKWIAHGCRQVISRLGKPNGRRVSNRDITPLKMAEQLAQTLAHFDTVTGLPNRRLLQDRLSLAVSSAKRHKRLLALMFIDLDKFKYVNDTHGHDVGDELLIEVAHRFSACVRRSDTVARMGGDEFVVLLPEIASPEDGHAVAQKILSAAETPVVSRGVPLNISASIGISFFNFMKKTDAKELMKQADIAMYQAKQAGRNTFRVYFNDK